MLVGLVKYLIECKLNWNRVRYFCRPGRIHGGIPFVIRHNKATAVDRESPHVKLPALQMIEGGRAVCSICNAIYHVRRDPLSITIALLWCITKDIPPWIRRDRHKCSRCFRGGFSTEHAVPSRAGKGGTRNFHKQSMENVWKSFNNIV